MTVQTPHAATTLPARWYSDPALWPVERDAVFAANWQFLTHESEVAAPRSWRAEVLAGWPVIVVRGDDGVLRGFHNVCRHRAGPLTREESGTCDGHLTCQYHGWKYMMDGRLRMARDFGVAADFDPREFGLVPIRLATWRGLVFAGLISNDMAETLPDLAAQMAPIDARLGDADWADLKVGLRRTHELDCNWKTYVENYSEGYHVANIHPGLDAEILSEQYKVTIDGKVVLHDVPPRSHDTVYNGVWAWMWPNIAINCYQRGLMIERMSPVGHARTRLDYLYLTPGGEPVEAATLAMSDEVTAEDKWIVERVQQNLDAGVYDTGRLSPKHEGGVAAFQAWVREAVESSGEKTADTDDSSR